MYALKTLADNKLLRYFILVLVSIVGVSSYMAAEGLFAMENTLYDVNGFYRINDGEYGALAGAYSILVVYGGALILGGLFIDKCGLRISGIVSTLLLIAGAGLMLYSMVDLKMMVESGANIPIINFFGRQIRKPVIYGILGFSIFGAGSETIGVVLTKILSKWFRGEELAFAMASQIAIARVGIGATYGFTPYLTAFYNGDVSIPLMIGVGILVLGLFLYLIYCLYDRKLDAQLKANGEAMNVVDDSDSFHWFDLGTIIRSKAFWAVCFICGFYYGSVRMFDKYAPGLVVSHFNIPETAGGLFTMITSWTVMILTPLLGAFVDKRGKSLDLLIGSSALAVIDFVLLDTFMLSKPLLYLVFVLNGVSFSLTAAALWPLVARILDLSVQGTGYAVVFLFQNIMFLAVPRLVTVVGTGTHHFVLVFAGLAIVSTVATIVFKIMDRKNGWKLNRTELKSEVL